MLREAGGEKGMPLTKRLAQRLKSNKKLELAAYGAVILAALTLYGIGLGRDRAGEARQNDAPNGSAAAVLTETDMEAKLSEVLSCIRGAGRVEVMVTYETGTELVTAMSTNTNSNSSESRDEGKTSSSSQTTESTEPATVSGNGGDTPIVLMERQPVVRGVIVVAEGAADIRVRLDLQRAVQAVMDIPLSKIEVFELSATEME